MKTKELQDDVDVILRLGACVCERPDFVIGQDTYRLSSASVTGPSSDECMKNGRGQLHSITKVGDWLPTGEPWLYRYSLGQSVLRRTFVAFGKGNGPVLPVRRPGSRQPSSQGAESPETWLFANPSLVSQGETVSGSSGGFGQDRCDPDCAVQAPLIAPEDMENPVRKRVAACASRPAPSPTTHPRCIGPPVSITKDATFKLPCRLCDAEPWC